MINLDRLWYSISAGTCGDFWKEFENYMGKRRNPRSESWWKEYGNCADSKEYFKNSGFYAYLRNKNRTELIDKILDA